MSQTQLLILISVLIIGALVFFAYFFYSQLKNLKSELKGEDKNTLLEWLKQSVDKNSETLSKELKDQRQSLEEQLKAQRSVLTEQTKVIWERLDNASSIIRGVQDQMSGIREFGTDIKDLSNILKSPKMRGGLGEQFLYEILANLLPKDIYKTQYRFKDGNICDAVILTDKGLIPIDSKFPMEKFKEMVTAATPEIRDAARKGFVNAVKEKVDEISKKYILPSEGTTHQALMYIPSENVYYELIVNTPEVEEYAKNKNIVMASPNTLSYFIKVLLVAFQQHELQKHAGDILKSLAGIKIEAEKFTGDLGVLEGHISDTYKSMDKVKVKFGKLFGKIEHASEIEEELESGLEQRKLLE